MNAVKGSLLFSLLVVLLALSGPAQSVEYPVEWLKSADRSLSLEAVRQLPDVQWTPVAKGDTVNAGFDDAEIWVRITLPPSQSERVLEAGPPPLTRFAVST